MERISVKKPFTVLVAVIIIIALGGISLAKLTMDLLPEISLPYLIVITAYPGASPEKVEEQVSMPMENALGTINGVANIGSTSSENYSMVQLEFEDGTDMNAAMVKVSSAINQIESSLPEGTMTPNIMEISLDMFATMYVAVERDDYDVYELTDFVNYDVIPYISRQEGVASVTTMGLVEKTVQVVLNPDKIADLNEDILARTNESLQEAQDALDDAREQLQEAQETLEEQQSSFGSTVSGALFSQMDGRAEGVAGGIRSGVSGLSGQLGQLSEGLSGAQEAQNTALDNARLAADNARQDLDSAVELQTQYQITENEARDMYDSASAALETVDPEDPAYQQLLQESAQAAAALAAATTLYEESSEEVTRAQEAFDQANAALNEATLNAMNITPEQVAQLQGDLNELSAMLSERSQNVSGASISDLIETTSGLSALMLRVSDTLSRVRQADPAGTLAERVDAATQSVNGINSLADSIPGILSGLQTATTSLTQGQLDAAVGFSTASNALSDARAQRDAAQAQYDSARESALASANADQFITPQTLSSLIYAQNFSMPVGYIDDAEDNSWLLKVGDEFTDTADISGALLLDNEILGTIRLEDVADVIVIDNANDSYTRLNGGSGVILCIYKSSSAGTNDVSNRCNEALSELQEIYPGMHSINLVDQGDYIRMIVSSVFQSILIGAALAIIILALFLKDVKPTIVVAISIPLSVLLALVLMYFTGLELNMMTLSGLSLGIGMLVDNSVVVMENIFRLRGKGISAPRAAVQGAKQVRGSIIASTLTTICVFLPSVFSDGTVRVLMYPMALSIGYCLVASLVIAMTVVPASCSTLMRNSKPREHKFFDKVLKSYGKSLRWCLRYKAVPLTVSVVLLAFSVYMVFRTGIVYIPNITTNEISITLKTPEDMTREESYAEVDRAMNLILSVDGITDLGIMDSGSSSGFLTGAATSDGSYGSYMCYALATEGASAAEIARIGNAISAVLLPTACEAEVTTGGSMGGMNLMGSSGLTINIYGNDYDQLHVISDDLKAMVENTEGFSEVTDSFSDGTPTLHLVIDRDKAMSYGLTVAQIYAGIAARTSTNITSTSVTINGVEMDVEITEDSEELTRENLMDIEFEAVDMTAQATGGAASGFAGASGASGASSFSGSSSFDMSMFGDTGSAEDDDTAAPAADEPEEEEPTTHKLSEFAYIEETVSSSSVNRSNLTRYVSLNCSVQEGQNTTLLSRQLQPTIDEYSRSLPNGYSVEMGGEYSQVMEMVYKMCLMAALALLFIYMIMVAQFQSLLSPLIILFTIPLAFTGGMIGLLIAGEQLSMLSLLGFVVLMGTVVNNGIVFVDFANQLRKGGLERRDALVATGITRMRPILMTALTTILAMSMMIFGSGMSSQLGRGMAIVISGGLLYATFMTLYIVPVMYDILFRRKPLDVDVGSDIDDAQDDAADFLASLKAEKEAEASASPAPSPAPAPGTV